MNIADIVNAVSFCKAGIGGSKATEAQKCFRISEGRIYSSNGTVTFSAPIPLEFDANPNADDFCAAVKNCDEGFTLGYDGAQIIFRSGKFSAKVGCVTEGVEVRPIGQAVATGVGCQILPALKALQPFIGDDPKRAWSNGILFRGKSAFATCNTIIIEHWCGASFPTEFIIPEAGVKTLLKIGEEPAWIAVDGKTVVVGLSGDRWFRIESFEENWPDVSGIFAMSNWGNVPETPEGLFPAMAKLSGFAGAFADAFIHEGAISVGGAKIEVDGLAGTAKTPWKFLAMLEGVATKLSFSDGLRIRFIGKGVRGLLSGKMLA